MPDPAGGPRASTGGRADRAASTRCRRSLDGAPLADVARRPGGRRSSCTPAARTSRCCAAACGRRSTNLFDTQVAAGFAGLGAQASYDSLLTDVLGLRVAKTASFTRWDARPLSAEQLAYAREDVVHLLELAAELQRRLRELGRLDWALEECEPLTRSSDERDPQTILERLPRVDGAERPGPARRARAGRVARADRRAPGPARPERPRRRRRWSRSPGASRTRGRSSRRSAASARRFAGAGRRAARRGRAAARERPKTRPRSGARAAAAGRGPAARRARRGAAADPRPRSRPRLRAAGRPRRPAGDRHRGPRRAPSRRRADAAGLAPRAGRRRAARAARRAHRAVRRAGAAGRSAAAGIEGIADRRAERRIVERRDRHPTAAPAARARCRAGGRRCVDYLEAGLPYACTPATSRAVSAFEELCLRSRAPAQAVHGNVDASPSCAGASPASLELASSQGVRIAMIHDRGPTSRGR